MRYASNVDLSLKAYEEWKESIMDQKSTYGWFFTMKVSMVSCCNRKQSSMALSTIEVEYIALSVRSSVASQAFDIFT
jgi:hypothetical protein